MADMSTEVLGFRFPNPVLPGAGPNVGSGEAMAEAAAGGAGGILTKTISPRVVAGHGPEPYRFHRTTLLNADLWTGFPLHHWLHTDFPEALVAAGKHGIPVFASVGYTASDLREVAPAVAATGVDALEFSIHGAEPDTVVDAAKTLRDLVDIPIIAKMSLHVTKDIVELAADLDPYVDAFTCINSVGPGLRIDIETGRAVLPTDDGYGWLSGESVRPIALRAVFALARETEKPIIASGGIGSGQDAIEFLMCGASLVQVCTAAIINGPETYGTIAQEMSDWLDDHGYASIDEVKNAYLDKWGEGQRVVIEFEEAPVVNKETCIGCTLCERCCFYDAIEAPPRVIAEVFGDPCFQCGICVTVCPVDALSFTPRSEVTALK